LPQWQGPVSTQATSTSWRTCSDGRNADSVVSR
jgi:hypothetical protein